MELDDLSLINKLHPCKKSQGNEPRNWPQRISHFSDMCRLLRSQRMLYVAGTCCQLKVGILFCVGSAECFKLLQTSQVTLPQLVSSVTQLCLTLCNPMNCSPPGFSAHGILQARILEWVAISYSRVLSNPKIKPMFLASLALAGGF